MARRAPVVSGPVSTTPLSTSVARARALARLMDDAVRIPGTKIGFGLDALIGLVPGIGDFVGTAMSGYIIYVAARGGVPPTVLARMLANVATDTVFGAVPVIGDLFDVAWKSNRRNFDLLDRYVADPATTRRSSRLTLVLIFLGVAVLIAASVGIGILLINWLLGLSR